MSHQRGNIIAPLGLWSTLAVIFKNSTALPGLIAVLAPAGRYGW
jgi:hypothetical protein